MSEPSRLTISRRLFLQAAVISAVSARSWSANTCSGPYESPDPALPMGPFDGLSTADDVVAGLDLAGKTAVVTGCNSGLGYETMRSLTSRGCHVIGTARNQEKAAKACGDFEGLTRAAS